MKGTADDDINCTEEENEEVDDWKGVADDSMTAEDTRVQTSQNSKANPGRVLKHHGPERNPPGLRQKLDVRPESGKLYDVKG